MPIELTAYEVRPCADWVLEPAPAPREWMTNSLNKGATRCLPLSMANQAGWIVRCPTRFKAVWDGRPDGDSTTLEFPERPKVWSQQIVSNFGTGIVSFLIPWLFRTTKGYGLFVRGPTNTFTPDIAPLDGLVETDWMASTFTMNWKILKPRTAVWFRQGDPICMLIPYPLDLLEEVQPRFASLDSNPDLRAQFNVWAQGRYEQVVRTQVRLDYMRGQDAFGERAEQHRTRMKVAAFADERTAPMA